jgi:transposase
MAMRLTDEQLDWLATRVPDAPVSAKGGRPAMDKRLALQGIFWILDNGAKWKDLLVLTPKAGPAKARVFWDDAGLCSGGRR